MLTVTTRNITAAWVAGCDGAHSAVRELSGITFPGAPYENVFFVADTEVTGNMVPDEVNVYLWQDGFHLFFPMRGKDRWRIIGILQSCARGTIDFKEVIPGRTGSRGGARALNSSSGSLVFDLQYPSQRQPSVPRPAAVSCSVMRRTSTVRSARRV